MPGHITKRLAISTTETTMNSIEVNVKCYMPRPTSGPSSARELLVSCMSCVVTAMDKNEFVPFDPVVTKCSETEELANDPLSLGNRVSLQSMSSTSLHTYHEDKTYSVPTTCGSKNYRRPYGLGSTLACNSVVLMYPDVQQYMVPSELRVSESRHLGFLFFSFIGIL